MSKRETRQADANAEANRVAEIRRRSADHLSRYLATDGADGYGAEGPKSLILTTTGRRSGAPRRTPLTFGRVRKDYVLVASNGGSPDHPAWYRNLRADPNVEVQVQANRSAAHARTAVGEERDRLWQLMLSILPAYGDYQKRTEREIPVVVLEPIS